MAGLGDGKGHWRLELTSALDIEPSAYVRTPHDFLASMHDSVKVALVARDMDSSAQSQALLTQLEHYPDTDAATSVCAPPDPLLSVRAQTGRDELVITGYDLLGESVAAIRDGRQAFAIDQQPFWRGYVPVMLLTHYIRYGLRQANHFLTGPSIVDASNVEEVAELVEQGYR